MRRGLAIWLVLFAAYAATVGLHAAGGSRYTIAEIHRLIVADSIVHDRDLDVTDQYQRRIWRDWHHGSVRPAGRVINGRRLEPAGIGTPLLIAPAYAVAGPTGVELWCAALLALAFALGAALARAVTPEPWATRAALLCGLSPPALAASTTIAPEAAGAALLTGAALLALRVREQPRLRFSFWCAALLAPLPWLSLRAAVPGVAVGLALSRWMRRRSRGVAGFVALEVLLTSAVVYVAVNDRLFGGLSPAAARPLGLAPPSGAHDLGDYAARLPRLLGLMIDRDAGLLRWAPVFALAGAGGWLVLRLHRERLAVVVAGQVDVEVTAALCGVLVALALGAGALAHRSLHGPWLIVPDLLLVLPVLVAPVALGLRRMPRAAGLLAIATLVGSLWMIAGARLDDNATLTPPHGALPWGGAQRILPRF